MAQHTKSRDMAQHTKSRGQHPFYPSRVHVSDDDVDWAKDISYKPVDFTHSNVIDAIGKWADKEWEFLDQTEKALILERITHSNGKKQRVKHVLHKGRPRNPRGRTGMKGRGLLGKHGPNHAADPIVTRYHKGKLQMVVVKRRDTGEFAIPGGMTEGQSVPATLKKEFLEEALKYESNPALSGALREQIECFFDKGGESIYVGYVDDPRNTDDAWMETHCQHLHMDSNLASRLPLLGGDDASMAMWKNVDANLKLYASHIDWVTKVMKKMTARERHPAMATVKLD